MSKTWKTGDQVRLKSGGPVMTVRLQGEMTIGGQAVLCEWFDKDDKPQGYQFEPDQLIEAKAD